MNADKAVTNTIKYGSLGLGIFDLIKLVGTIIVFTIVLIFLLAEGVSFWIVFPIWLILVIFLVLQIIRLRRIARVKT